MDTAQPSFPAVRRFWTDLLVIGTAFAAVAVAVWLVPASIAIVRWPATGPTRLAYLAPTRELVVFLAVAVAATLAVARLGRPSAGAWAPLAWLWLWAVPYLPWLPDRAPFLLLLAGPLRWAIAGSALVAVGIRWSGSRPDAWSAGLTRRGRGTVFAISLALYAGCGLYSASTLGLGGDEPHYLVITESLLRDGDLAIENNHTRLDYRRFFAGDLRPDYMERGSDGAIYSIHGPGLPAALLPAYVVAGWRGAVFMIALAAALTALAIFDLARLLAGPSAAWLTWAAVCLTVPFMPQSWLVFPEMPGALIVAWSALWLARSEPVSAGRWLARGLLLASLPWLHTKFIVFQAIFSVALVFRAAGQDFAGPATRLMMPAEVLRSGRLRHVLAFGLPGLVSVALWLYSFYAIYGVFNPEAPYGGYTGLYVLTSNIPHGLIGLFFDQKFGLLFYSPIYALTFVGAWLMWRDGRARWLLATMALVAAVFVGTTARLYMFWGGSSAPARFIVPVLPCVAPMLAVAFDRLRQAWFRGLVALSLAVSIGFTLTAAFWPQGRLFFSDPHGRARVLQLVEAAAPLAESIPTFTDPDWARQARLLAPWLGVLALAFGAAWWAGRRGRAGRAALAAVVAGAFGAAVITASPSAAVRESTARRGAVNALWTFDGERHRTFEYEGYARVPASRLYDLQTISVGGAVYDGAYATDPVAVPPGAYEIRVLYRDAQRGSGSVEILEWPATRLAQVTDLAGNPVVIPLDLPVTTRRLVVRVTGSAATSVTAVQVVPAAVLPPSARPTFAVRAVEPVRNRPNAYLIYSDANAYPEGGIFWTRGTETARVHLAPGGATRLRLTIWTGPNAGTVRIAMKDQTHTVSTQPEEPKELVLELPPGERLVPLSVTASASFRPTDANPASDDSRLLGSRVLIELE